MFDTDQLIADCRAALVESDAHAAVTEVVRRAVRDPGPVLRAWGEPGLAGIQTIHQAADLTILNVTWGPGMKLHPHNHEMWAVIGVYGGREDNTFYRRSESGLTTHGTKVLETRDTIALGEPIIHSVRNPLEQLTAAIHVYGGDFFETARSEWDPETFEERPYDVEHTLQIFEASNRRLREAQDT